MDVDFWASKVRSSKHFSAHLSSGNHVLLDNADVNDEDAKTYFTCPFCYVNIQLSMLCNHLQEEHCFDVKNAVCPVCALNLEKDVVGHFRVHHTSSIKARRRSQKSGFRSFRAGRSSLSGQSAKSGSEFVNGSVPDPLLSPFLCNIPFLETKGDEIETQDLSYSEDVSAVNETESSKTSMLNRTEEKENSIESRQRAAFCQHLLFSTII